MIIVNLSTFDKSEAPHRPGFILTFYFSEVLPPLEIFWPVL